METLQIENGNDLESCRAQLSQWEYSTDNGSATGEHTPRNKLPHNWPQNKRLTIKVEDSCEEAEDSLTRLNDLINPFNSMKRYLINKHYISKKTESNENSTSQKLLLCVEEFSQNFYYAFIAQSVLKLSKVILNPKGRLISTVIKLFKRENLSMCVLLAILGAGYKFGIEKLRKLSSHHDKINTFISICLAAWSLLQNKSKMKNNYMYFFIFWKYLEMMSKILEKGKVIKKVKKLDLEFYELWFLHMTIRFSMRVKISRNKS